LKCFIAFLHIDVKARWNQLRGEKMGDAVPMALGNVMIDVFFREEMHSRSP
jgi:hypothetical protein